jgi:4,5-dihydroxyphthalate decarboxylase
LAERHPDLVGELMRMFKDAKAIASSPSGGRDPWPIGRAALEPAIELALRYAAEQGLLPRQLSPNEVWEELPAELG